MTLNNISDALQEGQSAEVARLVKAAIASGTPAKDILEKGLLDGMS